MLIVKLKLKRVRIPFGKGGLMHTTHKLNPYHAVKYSEVNDNYKKKEKIVHGIKSVKNRDFFLQDNSRFERTEQLCYPLFSTESSTRPYPILPQQTQPILAFPAWPYLTWPRSP